MNGRIKTLMDTDFPVADCNEPLADAEGKLAASGLNALPVLNPDHTVFGMLSQHDILRFHATGANAKATQAWEICQTRPLLAGPDASVGDALSLYREHRFRELAIIDSMDRLAGLLTAERLLQACLGDSLSVPDAKNDAAQTPSLHAIAAE